MKDNIKNYEDLLEVDDLKLYKKILKEIEKNKDFYSSANPIEFTNSLLENCHINKKDLYNIIKIINSSNSK
ncbi:hypothetical protein [Halocella sp. SP3-1]|uniref:hypothetical protein n=1 Tax=Halocella sp. SP3-1 TaxID=2382161 RepID=UPI000F765102|nr:hypothetical protein [Halocella sp. SP3-1]AZO95315.1 hypothetical protein D7D81_12315 [Halocella sp. SP3-1]